MNTKLGIALGAAVLLSGQSAPPPAPMSAPLPARTSLGAGYLGQAKLPDSVALLPPPSAPGSRALRRDERAQKRALALRGTARWTLATADANLAGGGKAFMCAAGIAIGATETPKIEALLRRAAPDLGLAGYGAKRKYMRARPFMNNGQPTCTPEMETVLRGDGSYPSGHSALGYGWGMILADLVPERRGQLIARGVVFGDSRRICNVHYLSDIEAGRTVAKAVVAKLRADPGYQADFAAAQAEIRALPKARPDCAAEAAAIRMTR
ncbi:phosphatase PAP2 family protein [Sphingomonas sp. SUN039]|uniref:acid phosphatase n=1 Tax=Sphingomonas sp. SUN039 TaxID=2937787 RepID=UPI00216438C1|nr:phosphatase PAP2 family protein [Sphingomonas sp. SUN039]UVO54288.1 phosphatase PAP2 family protein [Sphingomonas sp. SUN039]